MQSVFTNALSKLLSQHTGLTASRRETLSWLVLLMLRQGSVCLWRLAAHVSTSAELASVQRRFYRFFQYVTLDGVVTARIIVALLGLHGKPWGLAMDRTNWDFGRHTINFLMISVEWHGTGVPLIWMLLPKTGNSSSAERIALFDRLAEAFPDMRIAALTGDREFIGDRWMSALAERKIPFVLRLRENQYVQREGYAEMTIATIANRLKTGETSILKQPCKLGRAPDAPSLRIVILRLASDELLALATPADPRKALARYRARWRIETLFANLKSKGFDLEATHLIALGKLSTLMALLALAVALAAKSGSAAQARKPIPIKTHGRRAHSLFAFGRAVLCKTLAGTNPAEIAGHLRRILANPGPTPPAKQCEV
jgi:Transposase DDE domain